MQGHIYHLYLSSLTRDLWLMTMCLTCMDVPGVRGLCGELRVNRRADAIRLGELRFMIIGMTVERQGPPSAVCFSSERVGVKKRRKRPI